MKFCLFALIILSLNLYISNLYAQVGCQPNAITTCLTSIDDQEISDFSGSYGLPIPVVTKIEHMDLFQLDEYLTDLLEQDEPYIRVKENQYLLDITFGQLSREQFDAIKRYFTLFGEINFTEDKDYKLRDFLPKAARGLVNHRFKKVLYPIPFNLEENENQYGDDDFFISFLENLLTKTDGASTSSNCWNTVFEVLMSLFGKNQYQIYWPGRIQMADLFKDESFFREVREPQPGDLLIVEVPDESNPKLYTLAHAAMFIMPQVVYEKTDMSDMDPYRLGLISDIHSWARRKSAGYRIRYIRYQKKEAIESLIGENLFSYIAGEYPNRGDVDFNDFLPSELRGETIIIGHELRFGSGWDQVLSRPLTIDFLEGDKIEVKGAEGHLTKFEHPIL